MEMKRNYVTYPRVQSHPIGESRTKQSLSEATDINWILRNQVQNGVIAHVNTHKGQYGDFATSSDYHDCMNKVAEANAMFSTLPARIRGEFNNDPAEFLDFVADPDNQDDMVAMGLIPPGNAAEQLGEVEPEEGAAATDIAEDPAGGPAL